jgi:hypothetical protein
MAVKNPLTWVGGKRLWNSLTKPLRGHICPMLEFKWHLHKAAIRDLAARIEGPYTLRENWIETIGDQGLKADRIIRNDN